MDIESETIVAWQEVGPLGKAEESVMNGKIRSMPFAVASDVPQRVVGE